MTVWEKGGGIRYDVFCFTHESAVPRAKHIISHSQPLGRKIPTSTSSTGAISSKSFSISTPTVQRPVSFTQLNDTDEKQRSRGRQLQQRKRLKKRADLTEDDDDENRTEIAVKKTKKKKSVFKDTKMAGFFDLEAEESGSGAGDDDEDDSDDESKVLSGDFINDGEYTQHDSGVKGVDFYFGVNRMLAEDCPDVDIRKLMRGRRAAMEDSDNEERDQQEWDDTPQKDTSDDEAEGEEDDEYDSDETTDCPGAPRDHEKLSAMKRKLLPAQKSQKLQRISEDSKRLVSNRFERSKAQIRDFDEEEEEIEQVSDDGEFSRCKQLMSNTLHYKQDPQSLVNQVTTLLVQLCKQVHLG
jgi:hypothetical protein